VIAWEKVESCSPILKTEVQCVGADGIQTNMSEDYEVLDSAMVVAANDLMKAPFMLKLGNAVTCRART
jgi:hypothetical protein